MHVKLHSMSGAILAREKRKIEERDGVKSSFDQYILDSAKAVLLERERLTKKWIMSINKFVEKKVEDMCLKDHEHENGDKIEIKGYEIINIKMGGYGLQAICINDDGWRYFFRSTRLEHYNVGSKVNLKATVKGSEDGITFLSRPRVELPMN